MADPPLIDAAKRGNLKDFRSLLNNGVDDIDAKCRAEQASSLHWAAYFGQTGMLRDLIAKKANINALHKKDDTPLHWAVVANQLECVELLLDADVNIDAQNNTGATAIVIAAKDGHASIVYALLERGADVTIEANEGKSALDYARSKGHTEVVQLLEDEAREPKAKLVYDLVHGDGHTHHHAVRTFFNHPRRFRTNPKVASAFLKSLERLVTNGPAEIAVETLLSRFATMSHLWNTGSDDDDEGTSDTAASSPVPLAPLTPPRQFSSSRRLPARPRSVSSSSSRASSRDGTMADDNEEVCSDDALELALYYSVFSTTDDGGAAFVPEAAAQRRRLLIECGKRYANPLAEPSEFVALGDRNLMVTTRALLQQDPDHLDKLLPVIKEFMQLQIDNAPPELLVRVVEAFRYTHRPSYMLALTAITCEPQFKLFADRMTDIIRMARDVAGATDEGCPMGSSDGSVAVGPRCEGRRGGGDTTSMLATRAAADDTAGPAASTTAPGSGDGLDRVSPAPRLILSLSGDALDDKAYRVTLQGGPIQRTSSLVELHQEADGVDPLFLSFGAAVAQRSGGAFDAPPRDALRTLEASGLRPDRERQWHCESVCNVTRGTLKYGSVSKMTLGIELLLACDKSLASMSQLGTALLGTDAVAIEIVSIWNRFAEPTTGGWADVLVQFAFDADDNRHIVELRLVHQDLALVAEEHNALGPYVKTRSALELLEAKGLAHRVPPPHLPQSEASPSGVGARNGATAVMRDMGLGLGMPSPVMSPTGGRAMMSLPPSADDRIARLEDAVQRLESTVADQARLISAQGEMIKQLLAADRAA